MTYLQFHIFFTFPLLAFAIFINRKNKAVYSQRSLMGAGLLVFLAMAYTTPWDSYLIKEKIWSYSPGNVLLTIYRIPIEEYFFFFIQTIIGCLITAWLLKRDIHKASPTLKINSKSFINILMMIGLTLGLYWIFPEAAEYRYLKLILFWALPIIFLQWSLCWKALMNYKTTLFTSVAGLSLYFWVADSIAIQEKIWTFPPNTISGIELFNELPLEEALFFLVTNIMVAQGYILFTQLQWAKSTESV